MPSSAFTFFNKIPALISKASAASIDDAVFGIKAAIPASIDDPAIKGKAFSGLIQDREIAAFKNVLRDAVKYRLAIIPAAVGLNAMMPGVLTYILGAGGAFLAYEAGETTLHYVKDTAVPAISRKLGLSAKSEGHAETAPDIANEPALSPDEFQEQMETGFKQTDLIMTSEVTGISLGAMQSKSIMGQLGSLTAVSATVTAAVFGTVFAIIRADNAAMWLEKRKGDGVLARTARAAGPKILKAVEPSLKGLSVLGTTAMFWIGGELIAKAVPPLEHAMEHAAHGSGALSLAFASAVGLGAGVSLAAAHQVPAVHSALETMGEKLKPVFNKASGVISSVKENLIKFIPRKEKACTSEFETASESKSGNAGQPMQSPEPIQVPAEDFPHNNPK